MDLPGSPRNRTPLGELPVRQGVSPQQNGTVIGTPTQRNALTPRLVDSPMANILDHILTPTVSPEEMIIRQRGRRRRQVIWSPDGNGRTQHSSPAKTPTKASTVMTLRSSPRKRSLMQEFSEVTKLTGLSSPLKRSLAESPASSSKKSRVHESAMNSQNDAIPLGTILQGYGRDQLIAIIESMVARDEKLEGAIRSELSLPDIGPLDAELGRIKKNIYASVPNQKIYNRTDGHGFLRAATHLATFKQTVFNQSQSLCISRHWDALLDYVLMAWTHVRETPVYENDRHNATRRYCFKLLSHHANCALKHGALALGTKRVTRLQQKLSGMAADWPEITECRNCISDILKSCC
ncbi:uncharacterized protein LOC128724746 [Anopheles nili]|uniref:uncharacterized protein LOC128724746 n=1 Tax=Anopheles nili TaxID=185578 RepID=UPI00237A20C5|nr:uncharacterized protein LOC128724746 [Anopheles nili]